MFLATSIMASILPAAPIEAGPSAYELLEEVRRAYYGDVALYRDRGEIEITVRGARGDRTRRLLFEIEAASDGDFRCILEAAGSPAGERKVIWRTGGEAFHFDSLLGQVKAVASPFDEMAESLGLRGPGGFDALVVPALLLGGERALPDPQIAALEDEEGGGFCGAARCLVVALARDGGAVESRLWVEPDTGLVRRVEVGLHPAPVAVEGKLEATRIVVRHQPLAPAPRSPGTGVAAFKPPPEARRVDEWQGLLEASVGADAAPAGGRVVIHDRISVDLISLTARALDARGRPIRGLGPKDFRVRLDRREIPVRGVDWIGAPNRVDPAGPADPADQAGASEPPRQSLSGLPLPDWQRGTRGPRAGGGKFVVFFVQPDFHGVRIRGHLRSLPFAREIVASLDPEDWAAVVAFDSHLKLWQDFTRDREVLEEVLWDAIRFGGKKEIPRRSRPPSLANRLDPFAARKAASPERALELVGRALEPLAGEKVMVYLGWGLGRYGAAGFRMTPDYDDALRALKDAKVTVFVLDVTDAGGHTLELGLREVAEATGGTYAKMAFFPSQAAGELQTAISGHYLLSLDRGDLPPGDYRVSITLPNRKGIVTTRHQRLAVPEAPK